MNIKKYNVLFIGAPVKNYNNKWGGSIATVSVFLKSFKNDNKYKINHIIRNKINDIEDIDNLLNENKYDILHIDDTRITELFYKRNINPDVIGPITRSPIKKYGNNWKSIYDENFFYKNFVIRLNKNEEYIKGGKIDYTDKIIYVNHGIDTEYLKPSKNKKNIILWAGDKNRKAKGYDMWLKIKNKINIPKDYKLITLTDYKIKDYWEILNNTKIIVNTSINESFCNAMFEAKSKSIPSIYKKNLHNGRHLDCRIQVEYNENNYIEEIIKLLNNDNYYNKESILSRKYTVENFSLDCMLNSYKKVYDLIINKKYKNEKK